jgi:hypothetical protein
MGRGTIVAMRGFAGAEECLGGVCSPGGDGVCGRGGPASPESDTGYGYAGYLLRLCGLLAQPSGGAAVKDGRRPPRLRGAGASLTGASMAAGWGGTGVGPHFGRVALAIAPAAGNAVRRPTAIHATVHWRISSDLCGWFAIVGSTVFISVLLEPAFNSLMSSSSDDHASS